MIKDALDFIFGKADEAANPKPIIRKTGPRTRVVSLMGEETVETIDKPMLVRWANTLDSVATMAELYGTKPAAYVNEKGIVVILNEDDRLERVGMKFELSDQFLTLMSLDNGKTQRDLVKILRTDLAGCVQHESFLAIVRQLEFDVNRGNRADVQHTKESLGRSVEKQVRAKAGEMPEELKITVPLFSTPHDVPTEITLMCAITLDIDAEKIQIEPTGDSLSREKKRVMTEIISRLDALMPEESLVVFGEVATEHLVE